MLRWGPADKFRAPVPDGMTLEQAAAKVDAEFGEALRRLGDEVASAYGVPPVLMPLAWFRCLDVVVCASCRTEVEQGPALLRCPDCGRTAAKPEGWPS